MTPTQPDALKDFLADLDYWNTSGYNPSPSHVNYRLEKLLKPKYQAEAFRFWQEHGPAGLSAFLEMAYEGIYCPFEGRIEPRGMFVWDTQE